MKRRDFITLVASAGVAWPLAARAQQAAEPVIGILSNGSQEADEARLLPGFVRGLSDEGLTIGRNVTIESRWARGNYDLLPGFVADLVGRHAGVIVAGGTEAVARAAQAVSGAVPVVAIMAGDPVARGFVASVNRPGGNLTVVSLFTFDNNALVAKRLDLLHQLVPGHDRRVACRFPPPILRTSCANSRAPPRPLASARHSRRCPGRTT